MAELRLLQADAGSVNSLANLYLITRVVYNVLYIGGQPRSLAALHVCHGLRCTAAGTKQVIGGLRTLTWGVSIYAIFAIYAKALSGSI
mgnify:CR=1 FL=1